MTLEQSLEGGEGESHVDIVQEHCATGKGRQAMVMNGAPAVAMDGALHWGVGGPWVQGGMRCRLAGQHSLVPGDPHISLGQPGAVGCCERLSAPDNGRWGKGAS